MHYHNLLTVISAPDDSMAQAESSFAAMTVSDNTTSKALRTIQLADEFMSASFNSAQEVLNELGRTLKAGTNLDATITSVSLTMEGIRSQVNTTELIVSPDPDVESFKSQCILRGRDCIRVLEENMLTLKDRHRMLVGLDKAPAGSIIFDTCESRIGEISPVLYYDTFYSSAS